jgi:Fe-S-cluster containining protein
VEHLRSTSDWPCRWCRGACCGAFRVFLTPFDLARIMDGLQIPWSSVVRLVQVDRRTIGSRALAFSLGEEEFFLMALHRRASGCRFLLRFDGLQRCGIHAFRPLACRCFPFEQRRQGAVRRRMTPAAAAQNNNSRSRKLTKVPHAPCPPGWLPEGDAFRRLESDVARRAQETLLTEAILESWHEDGLQTMIAAGIPVEAFAERLECFLAFALARVRDISTV